MAVQGGEPGADAAPLRRPRVQLGLQGDAQQHGDGRQAGEAHEEAGEGGQGGQPRGLARQHPAAGPQPLLEPGVQHSAGVGAQPGGHGPRRNEGTGLVCPTSN